MTSWSMLWNIKLQVRSHFAKHVCSPCMTQAMVFEAIYVAMPPVLPVSQKVTIGFKTHFDRVLGHLI